VEAKTVELIRRHGLVRRCIVSSFDPLVVRRVRLIAPEIPVAAIYASTAEIPYLLRRAGARAVSGATVMKPHHASASVRHIAHQHRRGRLVMPWTVDEPDLALELASRGADAIITNRPGEIRDALREARGELLAD
jgi:glycerophosphoryl diester phosphodiesterase